MQSVGVLYSMTAEETLLEEFRGYVIMEPRPFVIDLERCEGMYLVTVEGRRIFDWANYYASKLIGHNHPRLYEPEYVKRLVRAANNKVSSPDYVTPELIDYYRLLHRLAPRCMKNPELELFTLNSGAEAVENALKYMLKLYHEKAGEPDRVVPRHSDRPCFVYFEKGFHGRTVYTLNVTHMPHNPLVTQGFHGLTVENVMAPFPAWDSDAPSDDNEAEVDRCLSALETLLTTNGFKVAGIIVEPMQGAGGHRVALPRFFQGLSRIAHRDGIPLCFDEVQTAGGPTGAVFQCDQFDLPHPPDVVVSAKKFGSGVLYMRRPMKDVGVLDSTWSGTLADAVRFVQEWKIVEEEGLLDAVPALEEHLLEELFMLQAAHPNKVGNVRGYGLYQGFTLKRPGAMRSIVARALKEEDLLLQPAGDDTVRLRPNLNVTKADIDVLAAKLDRLLARS